MKIFYIVVGLFYLVRTRETQWINLEKICLSHLLLIVVFNMQILLTKKWQTCIWRLVLQESIHCRFVEFMLKCIQGELILAIRHLLLSSDDYEKIHSKLIDRMQASHDRYPYLTLKKTFFNIWKKTLFRAHEKVRMLWVSIARLFGMLLPEAFVEAR